MATEAADFYFHDGKIEIRKLQRASSAITSNWEKPRSLKTLIARVIRHDSKTTQISRGLAYSHALLDLCILRWHGLEQFDDKGVQTADVPQELLDKMSEQIEHEIKKLSRNYRHIGGEVPQTGALINSLNGYSIDTDDWQVNVFFQGFNSILKEPEVGADMGIVVEIRNGNNRLSKAVLAQAKHAESVVATFSDPKLKGQVDDMSTFTSQCYGIAYTPNKVTVFSGANYNEQTTVAGLITDMARCRKGDRSISTIAQALEEDIVIEAYLTRKSTVVSK